MRLNYDNIYKVIALLRGPLPVSRDESHPEWNFNYGPHWSVNPENGRIRGDHEVMVAYHLLDKRPGDNIEGMFAAFTGIPQADVDVLAYIDPKTYIGNDKREADFDNVTADDVAQTLYTYVMFDGKKAPDWLWWFLSHPFTWSVADDAADYIWRRKWSPKSFTYQLQGTSLDRLRECPADIKVVDPDDIFTPANLADSDRQAIVSHIRGKSGSKVFAYLSIGEVEAYRPWFNKQASYLGRPNYDWPGCYNVDFWSVEWLSVLHQIMANIIADGFDGVVFDVCDAWERYTGRRDDMIALIHDLSANARRAAPNFKILANGGIGLIGVGNFNALVDGVVAEEIYVRDGKWRTGLAHQLDIKRLVSLGEDKIKIIIEYVRPQDANRFNVASVMGKGFLSVVLPDAAMDKLVVGA